MKYSDICKKLRGKGAGADLYYQPVYDKIRTYIQGANYNDIRDTTYELLTKSSKDFQLLLWFCHAELHINGTQQFPEVMKLISNFLEKFWEECYPKLDDEGLQKRQGMLESFFRGVLLWQNQQFFLDKSFGLTVGQWQVQLYEMNHGGSNKELDNLEEQLIKLSHKKCLNYQDRIGACESSSIAFENDLKKHSLVLGTFSKIQAIFSAWRTCFKRSDSQALHNDNQLEAVNPPPTDEEKSDDTRTISDRQSAYKAIGEIAAYLKTLDPHSVVPELLELLVMWENLTMAEILSSLHGATHETKSMLNMLADATQSNNKASAAK